MPLLKDYKLVRSSRNDPVADARLSAQRLDDAAARLRQLAVAQPRYLAVLHALAVQAFATLDARAGAGMALCFADTGPASRDLDGDLRQVLADRVCRAALDELLPIASLPPETLLALLFVVGWLRVAADPGSMSPSVMMPWVRRQLPDVVALFEFACAAAIAQPPTAGGAAACMNARCAGVGSAASESTRCRRLVRHRAPIACRGC